MNGLLVGDNGSPEAKLNRATPTTTEKLAPAVRCKVRQARRLTDVVTYDNTTYECRDSGLAETRKTRPVSWIRAALKEFEGFPKGQVGLSGGADDRGRGRQGRHSEAMHGSGSGVFKIALPFRGDAFRVVYAVQLADEIWVVHTFQKKSTQGIKTPKREIDVIKEHLKRLKEMLR